MEKREPSYSAGGNVDLYSHYWKQYGEFTKILKIELPYHPEILPLGRYSKKTKTLIQKDTCTPMFMTALFIVAKVWQQHKCPSTDEWIKKTWFIHTMKWYSLIKHHEVLPLATTWMELEGIMLSEISQMYKDKYCMLSLKYVEAKK